MNELGHLLETVQQHGYKILSSDCCGYVDATLNPGSDEFIKQFQKAHKEESNHQKTARKHAGRSLSSYVKEKYFEENLKVVGVALTKESGSLNSEDAPSPNIYYIAAWQPLRVVTTTLYVDSSRSSDLENLIVTRAVIHSILNAVNLNIACEPFEGIEKTKFDSLTTDLDSIQDSVEMLLANKINFFVVTPYGYNTFDSDASAVLLSGSFNPLHIGHEKISKIATELNQDAVVGYELSVDNAQKPNLSLDETCHRLAQFSGNSTVYVTNLANFADKVEAIGNVKFIVGFDIAQKIVDEKYYQDENHLLASLTKLRNFSQIFVVGRVGENAQFQTLEHLLYPSTVTEELKSVFVDVPESSFRVDISSTMIREKKKVK